MLLRCLGASSSFEDPWITLNGLAPLDVSQANGPQQTGRGYRLHQWSLIVVVFIVVSDVDAVLVLCLNM